MQSLLMITGSYPPARCGVGDYTAGLARALARSGRWNVRVLTTQGRPAHEDREAGVDVIVVPTEWSPFFLPRIVRMVRALQPDLVHMQFPTQGYGGRAAPWLLPALLRLRGQHVVQTWHEYVPGPHAVRPFAAAAAASQVIVVRPEYADRLPALHRWAVGRATISYVPNASSIPITELDDAGRDSLRSSLAPDARLLVGFFGFAYPHKRVEWLFDLFEPADTRLLLVTNLDAKEPYHRVILDRIAEPRWSGRASYTGPLESHRVADLLAACDMIVLPFADGGGEWNSSLHAVRTQGTFVVTTSTTRSGYDAGHNTLYCRPDFPALRSAIANAEVRRVPPRRFGASWTEIAAAHEAIYARALESA
jgi:glycosyltransferase involved in cell wall biosynthesis